MKVEYTNRYSDTQTFEVNERGNIQWKADFGYCRFGMENDTEVINMVDPSGGPYIPSGYNMGMFGKVLDGMIVTGFISNDDGWEILIDKTVCETK